MTPPTPSATASEPPAAPALHIPGDCIDLVPRATIHSEISPSFELIELTPDWGGPVAQDFRAQDGLICVWGIPQSDAGAVSVYVAERATDTDEQQVDAWMAAGYTECLPFLDACYYEVITYEEVGEVRTVHTLVEGFEMSIEAVETELDPHLVVARAVATSRGYV